MAKKRKTTRKRSTRSTKEVVPEHELPGGFWRQVVAVLMIVVAVILVLTWFQAGGPFLNSIHSGSLQILGYATYAIPVLLVYLAVSIFRSDTNRIPAVIWFASLLMLLWLAGAFGVPTIGEAEPTGGVVGKVLNDAMTKILDKSVVMLIYVVLIFITGIFILQTSPAAVFRGIVGMFRVGNKKEDAENAKVAREAAEAEPAKRGGGMKKFKVNRGVEAEEPDEKPAMKVRAMKSTAGSSAGGMASKAVEPTALMAVSDPNWKMPSLDLLEKKQKPADAGNIQQNAMIIQSTLSEFGIEVEMEGANIGPKVTQYTMKPPSGVNLSKILARDKELALNLAVDKIRIEAPIPGTRSVGVELPNVRSADVRLRGVLESDEWKNATDALTFAVGKDISGKAVVANLAKMPHLLIAGTTGSGKSVMTNTLISSLLYRNAPSDMKLIIVDPKQVEMVQYNDIPHLLTPIINSTDKALSAMNWAVNEMERRYTEMAKEKVRNIIDYNKKMAKAPAVVADGDGNKQKQDGGKMPYIVIIIDEMADLMMMAGKDLEMLIVRIAQKGRAAGIHLVLATQRPEVKVITGLIKANIPGRIAFAVGSAIDSRIMLDMTGAEKLLGKGDMLMLTTEMMGKPRRIQGAWASDEDVDNVTNFLREQRPPEYNDEVIAQQVSIKGMGPTDGGSIGDLGRKYDPNDPLVRKAVEISLKNGKFSTASLQTWLGKGHGYVAGLAIWFEEIGVIGPSNGNKPREVLISTMEEFEEIVGNL
ncbi:DNA translocase FtsK 4TM domain-containing protein [Candidatus Saccharibacteria bacterium]|nr:DNA translocase FtsK 4TM domain-containing protein [Candidatus Saccharibacteria bacterium]